MAQENKELLLKDLSARLLYGVKVQINSDVKKVVGVKNGFVVTKERGLFSTKEYITKIECCRPYLRPMSSMTEEEKEELLNRLPKYWGLEIDKLGDLYFDICDASYPSIELLTDIVDWLNAHHFDYRGLIKKGLAIEAPKGMYK